MPSTRTLSGSAEADPLPQRRSLPGSINQPTDILQLTEKTVRDWAAEGVLTVHQHRPRLLLDADRLHRVSHLVADLRRAGRTRGLLDEVYRRLADDALAGRDDLAESLAEMRGGEGRVVRSATTTP